MSELKSIIHKDSRSTTEKYIRWEYEDVAPMPSPKETQGMSNSQKDIDERTKNLLFNKAVEKEGVKDPIGLVSLETYQQESLPSMEDAIAEEYGQEYESKFTDEGFAREAKYTNVQAQNIKEQKEKIKESLRTDAPSYSKIKINRIDGYNEYADIQLINADRFQKVSDPTRWSVLTLYTGSGKTNQAIGIMVRKANMEKKVSKVSPERNIFGTPEWTPEDKTEYNTSVDSIGA